MARSKEEIISEMVDSGLFSDDEIRTAVKGSASGAEGTSGDESMLSKANRAAFETVGTGMDLLNAPFEMVGESFRNVIERNPGGVRAPSVVQRFAPSLRTEQPPANPFSLANALLRAAAYGASGLPSGLDEAGRRANEAYFADPGIPGAIADAGLAALTGKIAPQVVEAPITAMENMAEAGVNLARSGVKKGLRVALGPSEEAISARFNRPTSVKNAPGFDELGDQFASTLEGLQKKVDQLDDQAWSTLLKLKAESQSKLVKLLQGVRREFVGTGKSKVGNADRAAARQIDNYIERIKAMKQPGVDPKLEQMLDQPQIREIIQSIRRDARYDLPENDPVNLATQAAGRAIDNYLKTENKGFDEAMKPLRNATDALMTARRKFRIGQQTGEGLVPTDTTVSRLKNFKEEARPEATAALEKVNRETGVDYQDKVNLSRYRNEFEPGERSRGSARTLSGGLAGMALEPFIPGPPGLSTFIGGAAGRTADYYGGPIAAKIIDALAKSRSAVGGLLQETASPQTLSSLEQLIRDSFRYQPALRPLLND